MSPVRSLQVRLIVAVITATAAVVAVAATSAWLASVQVRGLAFDQELREQVRTQRPFLEVMAWRHDRDPALPIERLAPTTGAADLILVLRGNDGDTWAISAGQRADASWFTALPVDDGVIRDAELPGLGAVHWLVLPISGRAEGGAIRPPRERREDDPPPPPDQDPGPHPSRRERDPQRPVDPSAAPRPSGRDQVLGQLVAIRPTRVLHAELASQAWLLAGMGLMVCVLVTLIVSLIITRMLRPLVRLGDGIAGVVPGEPAVIAVPDLPSELLPVQARLNELLARVVAVLERERQTTANIAHELRTPLAGLRAKLELALMREREPEQIAGLCRQGLATMTQLQALVDNLLLLARLEAGQATLQREAVEIAEAVAVAWSLHQVAAEVRGLRLERTIEPALALTTDAGKLRAILGNLLSNAVTYAEPGSAIRLEAVEGDGGVRIVVANQGATIAATDAERVFEPFWRGDGARTVESGHCGLGLPLVRRLATIIGGTITVAVADRRFIATLILPEDAPRR